MKAIICLIVSAVGAYFGDVNFFVIHTIVSTALEIYSEKLNHTNDKTALQ